MLRVFSSSFLFLFNRPPHSRWSLGQSWSAVHGVSCPCELLFPPPTFLPTRPVRASKTEARFQDGRPKGIPGSAGPAADATRDQHGRKEVGVGSPAAHAVVSNVRARGSMGQARLFCVQLRGCGRQLHDSGQPGHGRR